MCAQTYTSIFENFTHFLFLYDYFFDKIRGFSLLNVQVVLLRFFRVKCLLSRQGKYQH